MCACPRVRMQCGAGPQGELANASVRTSEMDVRAHTPRGDGRARAHAKVIRAVAPAAPRGSELVLRRREAAGCRSQVFRMKPLLGLLNFSTANRREFPRE